MITLINYKMGNLQSVQNALDYLEIASEVTDDPVKILQAEKIILPGVGSFNMAMNNIKALGLLDPIAEMAIQKKIPILGICLGMQLMAKSSDEDGFAAGFGFIDAEVKKFDPSKEYTVPHVGFNSVRFNSNNSTLFKGLGIEADFYFVHSFRFGFKDRPFVSGVTEYGEKFISAFEQDNIFGVQFHPEKSQSNGLKILDNFAKL